MLGRQKVQGQKLQGRKMLWQKLQEAENATAATQWAIVARGNNGRAPAAGMNRANPCPSNITNF